MSTTPTQPEAMPEPEPAPAQPAQPAPPDEKLVLQYPDAAVGRPRRFRLTTKWPLLGGTLGTAVVAGGATLTMISATAQPLLGATKSCKLNWEQRSAEIDQAVAAQPAPQNAPAD